MPPASKGFNYAKLKPCKFMKLIGLPNALP